MDGEWDGRTKLGQSVANGGGSGGGYSFSPLFLLSPSLLCPPAASCFHLVFVPASVQSPMDLLPGKGRKEGRKVTSSVANGR